MAQRGERVTVSRLHGVVLVALKDRLGAGRPGGVLHQPPESGDPARQINCPTSVFAAALASETLLLLFFFSTGVPAPLLCAINRLHCAAPCSQSAFMRCCPES